MFRSSFQRTALHAAAHNGHFEACQVLIAGKADVHTTTDRCAICYV
jgi:ankyrin repeat protein